MDVWEENIVEQLLQSVRSMVTTLSYVEAALGRTAEALEALLPSRPALRAIEGAHKPQRTRRRRAELSLVKGAGAG